MHSRTIQRGVFFFLVTLLFPFLAHGAANKVEICHFPPGNPGNAQSITINYAALPSHLAHGDVVGPCPSGCQLDSSICDDGNLCTHDICLDDGQCAHEPINCDDGNICTVDSCLAAEGCIYQPADGTICDQGIEGPNDACDLNPDTCQGGVCVQNDPEAIPESCDVAGDEDCNGLSDEEDPVCSASSCEELCFADFEACVGTGTNPAQCEELLSTCLDACTPPTCEESCFMQADEFFAACLEAGGDPAVCEQEAIEFLELCTSGCDRPTCEEACLIQAEALLTTCLEAGEDPAVCEQEAIEFLELCLSGCPPPKQP